MLRVSSIGDACFSRSPGATGRGGWWSHLETADVELNVADISIKERRGAGTAERNATASLLNPK